MPLTAEERAEVSRQNGRKSRGPITAEGKGRSKGNALKHGLRAEVVPLPHEDPEAFQARIDEWYEHFRPRSPDARHLVDRCARATLLAERCAAYHDAILARQVRRVADHWEYDRVDEVARLVATLADDPATAVRLLRRSAHGCRWMLDRWERLEGLVNEQGFLMPENADEAIQLLGVRADLSHLYRSPPAFRVRLSTAICRPGDPEASLKELFAPWRVPQELRLVFRPEALPSESQCWRMLRELIAEQIAGLRAEEARLREEVDVPDRAEAISRALIPHDPADARLFLRYHAESRHAFDRAHKALLKLNDEHEHKHEHEHEPTDLDSASPAPASENSPNEPGAETPNSPNEPGAETPSSPNEPSPAVPAATAPVGPAGAVTGGEGEGWRPEASPTPGLSWSAPPVFLDGLAVGLPVDPAQVPGGVPR